MNISRATAEALIELLDELADDAEQREDWTLWKRIQEALSFLRLPDDPS